MPDPCPDCGVDRVLVGYRHNCRPRSVPSASAAELVAKAVALKRAQTAQRRPVVRVSKPKGAEVAAKPKVAPAGLSEAKRGRARIEDRDKSFEATKPWLAAGMSRASWYRRRKERK